MTCFQQNKAYILSLEHLVHGCFRLLDKMRPDHNRIKNEYIKKDRVSQGAVFHIERPLDKINRRH